MTVTMSILFDKLSLDYRCRRNKKIFFDNPIRSLLLYSRCCMPSEYAYVAEGSELRQQDLAGASVISVGEPDFDYKNIPCDLIIVESVADMRSFFNRVQTIYLSLLHWNARLEEAAHHSMDLGALLEEGRQEMNYSFVFLNAVFQPIAVSADLRTGANGEMDEELLARVLRCQGVEDMSSFSGSREFEDPATGKRGLYSNIYYKSDYRGKLVALCEGRHGITRGDHALFENLCGHAEKMYEMFSASSMRSNSYRLIQHALHAVFQGGGEFDKTDLLGALQVAGWGVNDDYVVFFIPFGEKGGLSVRSEYIVTLMENRWGSLGKGSTRGTVLDYGIVWVVNCSRPAGVDYSPLYPEIEDMLRRYNAKLGVSAICRDFFSLPAYLKQAGIAIHFGERKESNGVVFRFGKYSLDYMLDSMLGNFTAEDVIHPSLPILMAYDKENNTEFCKTLRMFIRCKYNVLQASSELFIHRSTFSVRIKRIESLCNIDLDDERTRLHILVSFYILEKLGRASY